MRTFDISDLWRYWQTSFSFPSSLCACLLPPSSLFHLNSCRARHTNNKEEKHNNRPKQKNMRKMDGGRTLKGFEEQPGTKCSHQNSWSRTPALKVRRSSERLVSFLSTHPPVHLSTPLPICLGQPFRAWRPREGHEADGEQEWRWRREAAGRDFLTTFWCDGGRRNAQDALRPEIPRVSRRQTSVSIFRIGEWESKAERNVAKILELKKCSWLLQWWEESSTVSNS